MSVFTAVVLSLHTVEEFIRPFADIVRWPSLADADHFPYRVFLHGALNGLGLLFNQVTDQASDALAGAAGLISEKAILPFWERDLQTVHSHSRLTSLTRVPTLESLYQVLIMIHGDVRCS
jgi:hypothetical protein